MYTQAPREYDDGFSLKAIHVKITPNDVISVKRLVIANQLTAGPHCYM